MEFNGWRYAQWKEFVIYGDTEAFLVPTDSSSSSISTTFLNNVKRNWSINDDDDDEDGVVENLNLGNFVDLYDETDEESGDEDDNRYIEDEDIIMTDVNSGLDCKKKPIKPMPNEEPHRKRLHPWLKTKTLEPTQKKSRQDLSAFKETNSVKHEHKLVIIILITSDFVQYFVLG